MKVYIDMDATLVDFAAQVTKLGLWRKNKPDKVAWDKVIKIGPSFWSEMEWMPGAENAFNELRSLSEKGVHENVEALALRNDGQASEQVPAGILPDLAQSAPVWGQAQGAIRIGAPRVQHQDQLGGDLRDHEQQRVELKLVAGHERERNDGKELEDVGADGKERERPDVFLRDQRRLIGQGDDQNDGARHAKVKRRHGG